MSKQLLNVGMFLMGWLVLCLLLHFLQRRVRILGLAWPFAEPASRTPRWKLSSDGRPVLLKHLGGRRFALELRCPPNYATAEFEARSWSSALAEAKRLVPGLVVRLEPAASDRAHWCPTVANSCVGA